MLEKANFEQRRHRLLQRLDGATMLVANLVNVQYLTGFTGSNAFLLVADSKFVLLTDGRYTTQVADQCPDLDVLIRPVDSSMIRLIAEAFCDLLVVECLVESDSVTRAFWSDLDSEVGKGTILQDSSGIVESLRAMKEEDELRLIRQSVQINEDAFEATLKQCDRSWSELEFSWHLEREIRQRGGAGFSFDPIVAVGSSSSLPHYHASTAKIGDDPLVLVDWGTSFHGYASDLARVISTSELSAEIKSIHRVVLEAKQAACEAVKDGVDLQKVDSAARLLISKAGFEAEFNHGLGHGFGLEIHEFPFISPAFEGQLKEGMVITIEPGIYLPGKGGVRLEDDILVTSTGFERLNRLSDEFFTI